MTKEERRAKYPDIAKLVDEWRDVFGAQPGFEFSILEKPYVENPKTFRYMEPFIKWTTKDE